MWKTLKNQQVNGIGYGLNIVKRYVDLLHGPISFISAMMRILFLELNFHKIIK